MNEPAVVIAGGGPTGLMLAGELALAGVNVAIFERRPSQELVGARARGLHARTLEVLDQRGIADRFLAQGTVHRIGPKFSMIPLSIEDLPTRHNYVLGLEQRFIEHILADWIRELGVSIHYGIEMTGFVQDDAAVDVRLSDGTRLRAAYLIGCDGGRSLIRKSAGIDFPGSDPTTSSIIAEVELAEEPAEWGLRRDAVGIHSLSRSENGQRVHVLVTETHLENIRREPTLHDLREALTVVYGTDYGAHSPTLITRFTDATRQASSYRRGRILLAGDAAHVHPPDGGQGVQLGIQDAVNLGWKLARVVQGVCPDRLLDTYEAERHPAAARVLRATLASVALRREDEHTKALRETMAELLRLDEPRRRMVGLLSGLDTPYDLGEGHPLLGRRIPDLDIATAEGKSLRLFTLLHDARPVLLNFGPPGSLDPGPWVDRVSAIEATCREAWELPVLGSVPLQPRCRFVRMAMWPGSETEIRARRVSKKP